MLGGSLHNSTPPSRHEVLNKANTRLSRKLRMKIRYQISTIIHIGCWLSGSLRFVVALPVDEVLKPGAKKTGVEDLTDNILVMAIDADRRIRWNRSTREGVCRERFQQGHVEDWMKLGHGGR